MSERVIVITGGFGVLGQAVAALARASGYRTALIDASQAPPSSDQLTFGNVDLTKYEAAETTLQRVAGQAGRIDALLNIAGGFVWSQLPDADAATWERMHAVNLMTAVNATRAAVPHLLKTNGAIVNVGAAGAIKADAGFGPYAASKSGVHRLTESVAQELKGKVRVNAVLPSTLDTPQNRKDMPQADPAAWVRPEELAQVMLFLASDKASAVTGALIPVMGRV